MGFENIMKPFLVLAGDRKVDDITALVLLPPDAVACKRVDVRECASKPMHSPFKIMSSFLQKK